MFFTKEIECEKSSGDIVTMGSLYKELQKLKEDIGEEKKQTTGTYPMTYTSSRGWFPNFENKTLIQRIKDLEEDAEHYEEVVDNLITFLNVERVKSEVVIDGKTVKKDYFRVKKAKKNKVGRPKKVVYEDED